MMESAVTKPLPRPPRHLHIFGISLTIIVLSLIGFLFGAKMEATAPATGVVTSDKLVQFRAPKAGHVKLAMPFQVSDSRTAQPSAVGSYVGGGKEVARVANGETESAFVAPSSAAKWLIVELPVSDGQHVQEGELLMSLVPVDPETNAVIDLVVRIEIDEKQFGYVEPGQEVRLFSAMYHHRTHGVAKGVIDRLEPMAVEGPNGSRKFHGWVRVTEAPFPLKLGSSVRVEIVTGRKRTYQIILEH
jgi:hypothetical protein